MTKQTVYLNNMVRKSGCRLHYLRQSTFKTHHCWRGLMTSPVTLYFTIPACIAQWSECSTRKLEVVGSIPGPANLTIISCLSDETLNRGPVWRCYTPSTLKNQSGVSVVSSCILALSPVTTNRLLGAPLRWATGSDDK